MPRVVTEDMMRDYFGQFGYELIQFRKGTKKIKQVVKCTEGHQYDTTFNNFKRGARCKECYRLGITTKRSVIENYFEKFGYKLIEFRNGGVGVLQLIRHECGHQYEVTFNNFKDRGARCKKCYHKNRCIKEEEMRNRFSKFGYELAQFREGGIGVIQIIKHIECGYQREISFQDD